MQYSCSTGLARGYVHYGAGLYAIVRCPRNTGVYNPTHGQTYLQIVKPHKSYSSISAPGLSPTKSQNLCCRFLPSLSAPLNAPGHHYDQCKAPSLLYFRTKFQYSRRFLSRRVLPHFTISRNARLAASPMKAAEMKQF
jgi:hypothetical protein